MSQFELTVIDAIHTLNNIFCSNIEHHCNQNLIQNCMLHYFKIALHFLGTILQWFSMGFRARSLHFLGTIVLWGSRGFRGPSNGPPDAERPRPLERLIVVKIPCHWGIDFSFLSNWREYDWVTNFQFVFERTVTLRLVWQKPGIHFSVCKVLNSDLRYERAADGIIGTFPFVYSLIFRTYTISKFERLNQIKWLGPNFLEDFIWTPSQWPSLYFSFIYG